MSNHARRHTMAQVSGLSCLMKGGFEFIPLGLSQTPARRAHFLRWRGGDDFLRGDINGHKADVTHHTIPGPGQEGRNNPHLRTLEGQTPWTPPAVTDSVVPQAVRVGHNLHRLESHSCFSPKPDRCTRGNPWPAKAALTLCSRGTILYSTTAPYRQSV